MKSAFTFSIYPQPKLTSCRKKLYFMFLLAFCILLLSGCVTQEMREEQIRAELEAAPPVDSGGIYFYLNDIFIADETVYYSNSNSLYCVSDPSTPVREEDVGVFSPSHELFYKLSEGIVTSFNPVTCELEEVCDLVYHDIKAKYLTENYLIYGTSNKSYSLNLSDGTSTDLEIIIQKPENVLAIDNNIIYYTNAEYDVFTFTPDAEIYSFNLDTMTKTYITTSPSGAIMGAVHGDSFYLVDGAEHLLTVSGLGTNEISEIERAEASVGKGSVIAVMSCDEGVIFVCSTRPYTLDLWLLPDEGEPEMLASWEHVGYQFIGSGKITSSGSLIAYCVSSDDRIFTYDLETQESEVYYAK